MIGQDLPFYVERVKQSESPSIKITDSQSGLCCTFFSNFEMGQEEYDDFQVHRTRYICILSSEKFSELKKNVSSIDKKWGYIIKWLTCYHICIFLKNLWNFNLHILKMSFPNIIEIIWKCNSLQILILLLVLNQHQKVIATNIWSCPIFSTTPIMTSINSIRFYSINFQNIKKNTENSYENQSLIKFK